MEGIDQKDETEKLFGQEKEKDFKSRVTWAVERVAESDHLRDLVGEDEGGIQGQWNKEIKEIREAGLEVEEY